MVATAVGRRALRPVRTLMRRGRPRLLVARERGQRRGHVGRRRAAARARAERAPPDAAAASRAKAQAAR